ncbi:MAG TPA: HEAT repeat domain-containing protein [Longimicrobium sp.]|jgi:HEAT repeat protein
MKNITTIARRPLPRAAAMAGLALVTLPAVLVCGVQGQGEAAQEGQARAFLAAVRGIQPVACELVVQSAGNHWGMGGMWDDAPMAARQTEDTRRVLAWAGGGTVTSDDLAVLTGGLGDADACVRRVSARILGRRRVAGGVDALLAALRSGETARRDAAIVGLGYAGDARAVAPLTALLSSGDAEVRGGAVWALGHTESREAGAAVARLAGDREARVRQAVARALGRLEDTSSVPTLTRLLSSDSDAEVRRAAAWALGRMD